MSSKDHFYADALLRELVDRMGKDLVDAADSYIDPLPLNDQLEYMARENKGMVDPEQMDYDALLLEGNPSTALRDQEYLQQNALWGHQYVSGGAGEGPHRLKPQIKTDASLPAYCNPPNPCPVGVSEEQGCLIEFENSASFSREYQASQECMCDAEHMFECPNQDDNSVQRQMNRDMDAYLAKQFSGHKNMVAKKYQLPQVRMEVYYEYKRMSFTFGVVVLAPGIQSVPGGREVANSGQEGVPRDQLSSSIDFGAED